MLTHCYMYRMRTNIGACNWNVGESRITVKFGGGGTQENWGTQEKWLGKGITATKREQMPVCISLKCV